MWKLLPGGNLWATWRSSKSSTLSRPNTHMIAHMTHRLRYQGSALGVTHVFGRRPEQESERLAQTMSPKSISRSWRSARVRPCWTAGNAQFARSIYGLRKICGFWVRGPPALAKQLPRGRAVGAFIICVWKPRLCGLLVSVHVDSKYAIGSVEGHARSKVNEEAVPLCESCQMHSGGFFPWLLLSGLLGTLGHPWNELADASCKAGCA